VRMPPAAPINANPTPVPNPALVHPPAQSVGRDPDPSQPLVVVEKPIDPARHRPTMLTRKPDAALPPQARATVLTRAVDAPPPGAPVQAPKLRSMGLLVGLLVFFAILSVGTAALFVVQRLSH
jgi:hypothetical protein